MDHEQRIDLHNREVCVRDMAWGEAQISSVGAVSPVTVSDVIVWCEKDHGSWPDSTNRSD